MSQDQVVVVGAGAAGLSAANVLHRAGHAVQVLENADRIAESWRSRHPQLRLNTHRTLSALPGMSMPKSAGAFPHRDDVAHYLEAYAERLAVPVKFGVELQRLDRSATGWRLTTSAGSRSADHVVVATGFDSVPHVPRWDGLEQYRGRLLHAADFGDVEQYRAKRVLVIGAGNSGSDVLNHLSRVGAQSLHVSVRHGPAVFPKCIGGFAVQRLSPIMEKLPPVLADRMIRLTERLSLGDLSRYGLPQHPDGAATRLAKERVAPAIDDGFVAALKAGRLSVVPSVLRFEQNGVVFADGSRLQPDVVISATGYRTGLEPALGHLGVLDDTGRPLANGAETVPGCPGLWFIGMRPRLSGYFRAAGRDAARIAHAISSMPKPVESPGPTDDQNGGAELANAA